MIGEVREPIPAAPSQPERYDCEYRCNGTANLFVFPDAHRPWRHVKVTEHRAACDFAFCMRDLADIHYPNAELIRVVMDNLSTHNPGALCETFPASEAHRILQQRLEFHYTPKHASWLNMVEIEIGVLRGQCLDRRIGERETLIAEIEAWQRQRNASGARIKWKFTTQKARHKLARAYPDTPRSHNHCDEVLVGARINMASDMAGVVTWKQIEFSCDGSRIQTSPRSGRAQAATARHIMLGYWADDPIQGRAGCTRMRAIMPPSSCSRIWQW